MAASKRIDLRTDTVTRPSDEMRQAMANAAVGDDAKGEDPTVNALQQRCAELFGMEAALFVPSGIMGNLIALLVHCPERGSEIIIGNRSHIFCSENVNYCQHANLSAVALQTEDDGTIDLNTIRQHIRPFRPNSAQKPKSHEKVVTKLICVENTHNFCGGRCLPLDYLKNLRELADEYGLKIHMDGARLMNAAVGTEQSVAEILKYADSVCFCFSKGLGAPVGSVIAGSKAFIEQARIERHSLGGALRQAGVLAAAAHVALDKAFDQLSVDHQKAKRLANGVQQLHSHVLFVDETTVETNIVLLKTRSPLTASRLSAMLKDRSIGDAEIWADPLPYCREGDTLRMVTHCDISQADIDIALEKLEAIVTSCVK